MHGGRAWEKVSSDSATCLPHPCTGLPTKAFSPAGGEVRPAITALEQGRRALGQTGQVTERSLCACN